MIIGVAAKARSGKDMLATVWADELKKSKPFTFEFMRYSFADPLKDFIDEWLGLTSDHREGFLKEIVQAHPVNWNTCAAYLVKHYGSHPTTPVTPEIAAQISMKMFEFWSDKIVVGNNNETYLLLSPRQLYQDFGTDIIRDNVSDSFWLDYLPPLKLPNRLVIVPDVRFDNEAELIRNLGGKIIHVIREDAKKVQNHSSEQGVTPDWDDLDVLNEGTLEEYERICREAFHRVFK